MRLQCLTLEHHNYMDLIHTIKFENFKFPTKSKDRVFVHFIHPTGTSDKKFEGKKWPFFAIFDNFLKIRIFIKNHVYRFYSTFNRKKKKKMKHD